MVSVTSFEHSITHALSSQKCSSHAQCVYIEPVQSNPVNTDTEGVIESVRINEVSVLSGLNLEKM